MLIHDNKKIEYIGELIDIIGMSGVTVCSLRSNYGELQSFYIEHNQFFENYFRNRDTVTGIMLTRKNNLDCNDTESKKKGKNKCAEDEDNNTNTSMSFNKIIGKNALLKEEFFTRVEEQILIEEIQLWSKLWNSICGLCICENLPANKLKDRFQRDMQDKLFFVERHYYLAALDIAHKFTNRYTKTYSIPYINLDDSLRFAIDHMDNLIRKKFTPSTGKFINYYYGFCWNHIRDEYIKEYGIDRSYFERVPDNDEADNTSYDENEAEPSSDTNADPGYSSASNDSDDFDKKCSDLNNQVARSRKSSTLSLYTTVSSAEDDYLIDHIESEDISMSQYISSYDVKDFIEKTLVSSMGEKKGKEAILYLRENLGFTGSYYFYSSCKKSISEIAKDYNIPYSRAWNLIKRAEKILRVAAPAYGYYRSERDKATAS